MFDFQFTAIGLTGAINVIPPQWGRISQMGLFAAKPSPSTLVEIVRQNGRLVILSAEERGSRANVAAGERDDNVIVKIPHFPYDDLITPNDIQNMVQIATQPGIMPIAGAGRQPMTLEDEINKRLAKVRRTHDITGEYLRVGGLKGRIYDGKGKELYNLFEVFGINQLSVDFKLGTAGTDIRAKCEEVYAHIEDNIGDDVVSGVRVECDPGFFGKLVSHEKVEQFYLQASQALELTGRNIRQGFNLHGLEFAEYRASAPGIDGQVKKFIGANEGHAYPTGTTQTFEEYNGPPYDIRQANQLPTSEIFVSPKELDHGAGIELATQSNRLPMCKRPEVLVRVYSSD